MFSWTCANTGSENVRNSSAVSSGHCSQVTTVTKSFFKEHLKTLASGVMDPHSWLTVRAANGIEVPYTGYVEIDMEVCGIEVAKRGVLIVKDTTDLANQKVNGLLGTVTAACKQGKGKQRTSELYSLEKHWTKECEESFKALKKALTTTQVLGIADYRLPFIAETDASDKGLVAVLSQIQEGKPRVSMAARYMTPTILP